MINTGNMTPRPVCTTRVSYTHDFVSGGSKREEIKTHPSKDKQTVIPWLFSPVFNIVHTLYYTFYILYAHTASG